MLVYGDHGETADPRERLHEIAEEIAAIAAMPPGIERHSRLVGALIEVGRVQQGVEDADCSSERLGNYVYGLGQCVISSWDSGFHEMGALPVAPVCELPDRAKLRLPEGFAFYAVYPEAYVEAARRLNLSGSPIVIGIRSIGTTLAAVVAAALDAPPPVTVRPFGDPFQRRVELPETALLASAHYVIVDEGPGLSGSSFGAVADWLQERGVPLERIAFVPGHAGDLGPEASVAHRARWHLAQRVAADFGPSFLAEQFGPLDPFSNGASGERLKFVGHHHGEPVLLKFAGLGAIGSAKLEMARALHSGGFTPEPIGLVHGFLIERWCGDARPLAQSRTPIADIGRYIGARARLFPAPAESGASVEELLTMCRRNVGIAFGDGAAGRLAFGPLPQPARVRTDNKLDRKEWLRDPDGRLIKTDALDHHQSHDLIGCQPPEWDLAGAMIEFELDERECSELIDASGLSLDERLIAFFAIAYASFRMGHAALTHSAEEERYRRITQVLLKQTAVRSAGILA